MNIEQNLPRPRQDGAPQADARPPEAVIEQLSETVEHVRNHFTRSELRLERMEHYVHLQKRYIQVLWVLVIQLILGFALLTWYGLPVVRGQRSILQNLPANGSESNPHEVDRGDSPKAPAALPNPVANATRPPDAAAVTAAVPTAPAVSDAGKSDARAEVSRPRRDAAADLPADDVRRQRVDFHLRSNQTEQVAPGIYLTIKGTNIGNQQVNGWLQTSRDGRIVWIRDQGAEEYLSFVSPVDSHPSFLVFTRIDSGGVAGYVMIPPARTGSGD